MKWQFSFSLLLLPLFAGVTIEEKIQDARLKGVQEEADLNEFVAHFNQNLHTLRTLLNEKYQEVNALAGNEAKEADFQALLEDINEIKSELANLETEWHAKASNTQDADRDGYALWQHDEIPLSQLIMEYGSTDFLYVIPPELANMKLQLHSSLPIPRQSWNALIELILTQNGVGIKQINPYTRQLFSLKQDLTAVSAILNRPADLDRLPPNTRLVYLFSPAVEHLKPSYYFFERFRDIKRSFVYQIGQKIAIVGNKEDIKKLLILYKNVWEDDNEKVAKVISLTKIPPEEAKSLLSCFFGNLSEGNQHFSPKGGNDLCVLPLANERVIVLIGPKDVVGRAEELIKETEGQVESPTETTVYWYTVRHSDPVELAEVLEKVYYSLIHADVSGEKKQAKQEVATKDLIDVDIDFNPQGGENDSAPADMYPYQGQRVVDPLPVKLGSIDSHKKPMQSKRFIPYAKSGQILMVVQKDTLDRLKEVLKCLDIPKKMVEIEVLMCEKRITSSNNFGLNLLKLGSDASKEHKQGIDFNDPTKGKPRGLFEYFIKRGQSSAFPAFDITYHFLMNQDDVRINASPTITTVNQTPCSISLVEEISIDNGAAPIDTNKGIAFQKSFTRAQFGITLVMTPTIHMPELDQPESPTMITLQSEVSFDTINSDKDDRPDVNRRQIKNLVCIPDGQTIILGGLRKKTGNDKTEKIPFLGEIPGIGKFFGNTEMSDQMTEMFIFITPRMIADPENDVERMRDELLCQRAGDLPEFLECLKCARAKEKSRLFEQTFRTIFGEVKNDPCYL